MYQSLRTAIFVAIGLTLGALALPAAALAQSAVRVTVNDQPITAYDISQRVKLMKLFNQKSSDKVAMEDLIDETLALQAAAKRKMEVSDAMVEDRYNAIAKQVKLSPANFTKALNQQGVQADTLRRLFRAQITFGMIMRAKARSAQANVSEADIQAELAKEGVDASSATMREYRLQQIVFVIPKGSQSLAGSRQRDAESFRKRFAGCDSSLEIAKSMKGVVVLDAGRRDSSQIDGEFGEALSKAAAGTTMKPEMTGRGVEVIAVCSVKEIQSTAGVRAEVEKKLTSEQNKDLDKTVKAELREEAKIVYN